MANIITNRKQRLRLKKGRFPENGVKGIGQLEIEMMPNRSHLTCPKCGSWKIGVSLGGQDKEFTKTGCGCGWESWIDAALLPDDFTGSCPKCGDHQFVIMKMDSHMGVGCSKCSWESVNRIVPESLIIKP